jgi:hypothetical protein
MECVRLPMLIGGLKREESVKRKGACSAVILLSLFFLSCATTHHSTTKVIPDSARVVRLYVPSCTSYDIAGQIQGILMRIDGVYDVTGDTSNQYVTVAFDPGKTSVEALDRELEPQGIYVRGKPVFIK